MSKRSSFLLCAGVLSCTSALAAQQPRVALCAAESSSTSCQFLDPQARLLATNLFSAVDIINVTAAGGGTPTLAQLLQYDALVCWSNSTPASTWRGATCSPTTSTPAAASW